MECDLRIVDLRTSEEVHEFDRDDDETNSDCVSTMQEGESDVESDMDSFIDDDESEEEQSYISRRSSG